MSAPETPAQWQELGDYIVRRLLESLASQANQPSVVDADGLASVLGTSKATVERKTREGTIPSFKVGDLRRYAVSEVITSLTASSAMMSTVTSTTTMPC
jgi:excisionase family DNA binding protein